ALGDADELRAGLETLAARLARHAVPARRDRLDGAAPPVAPALLVLDADRGDAAVARTARAGQRAAAQPVVARRAAADRRRPQPVDLSHAARQGARRDDGGGADGPEDARAARPARCLRRVLPRLLHHPHALPLFAVAPGGCDDARVGVGPAHGA